MACVFGKAFGISMEMREHDFVGKERRPFKGSGAVDVNAADEFMLPVRQADEAGFAKLADELTAIMLGNQIFQSHTPPRYASGLDIGDPCKKKSKPARDCRPNKRTHSSLETLHLFIVTK